MYRRRQSSSSGNDEGTERGGGEGIIIQIRKWKVTEIVEGTKTKK